MTSGPCLRRYSRGVSRPSRCPHLFRAALQDAADDHARARRDRRPAVGHDRGVGGVHVDAVVRQPERVGDDLRVHRPRALTDLGARDENPRAALGERERRLRRELDLAAAGEARSRGRTATGRARARCSLRGLVAPKPRSGGGGRHRPSLLEIGPLHRLAQHLQRAAVLAEPLAGRGRVARPQRVDLAHAHRIEPELRGDAIHVDFGRELRLRRAEAAERAVGRRVRHRRAAADADVIAAIRPAGVNHAAREDDGAQRRVGAAVEHGVDLDRRQPAVARHAGLVADDRRMALRRRDHVLDAVVDQLHRPAGLLREQRGVPGDHRRVLFLAAEAAAGLRLHDADLVARQPEQHHQRAVHVVRALHRSVHGDPVDVVRHAVARHGDDAVRLDVELLLVPDPVLALDDDVGEREAVVDVPLLDGDRLEHRRRRLRRRRPASSAR